VVFNGELILILIPMTNTNTNTNTYTNTNTNTNAYTILVVIPEWYSMASAHASSSTVVMRALCSGMLSRAIESNLESRLCRKPA